MSANAYNPSATVLIKLAELLSKIYAGARVADLTELDDPKVLEWYARMADLQHVPVRRGIPAIHDAVLALAAEDEFDATTPVFNLKLPGTIKPPWALTPLTPGQINDALCCTGQRGYQIFASIGDIGDHEDFASYTEAVSVEEAIQKCLEQFPDSEGYTAHGVKDIETQAVIMAAYKTVLDLD